ncbi:MAG: DNA repair helicase XPB [Terrimicrobiaceae bacterium]
MPASNPLNPLIVQGDHTVLLEVDNPLYEEARDALARFAELVKSPEHIHTYRLTPLSIWNACAVGENAAGIMDALERLTKYPLPAHIAASVTDFAGRYGALKLTRPGSSLVLTARDLPLAEELAHQKSLDALLRERLDSVSFAVEPPDRGRLKQALIKLGYPTEDLAGYAVGDPLAVSLRALTLSGAGFALRDYQAAAAACFFGGGGARGDSGVVVLPCGAGKTIVAAACMAMVGEATLILTTGVSASRQWKRELLDKTDIPADAIGEYGGDTREVRPVTMATYQMLTHRTSKEADFTHFAIFDRRNWGLIVYDEVHLLPAPVFQVTASLQARRRLGLTATLVREDNKEDDVFALIGPKKYDVPWKEMEKQGWIARATCTEIRLPMAPALRMDYAVAPARNKFRIASENPDKLGIIRQLLVRHQDEPVLIIGMYVEQISGFSGELGLPVIKGSTPQAIRDGLYEKFRRGDLRALVVSKVANFSIDLPDASVAIQMEKFPLFAPPSERKQMDEYVDKHFVRQDADRMRCGFRDSQVPVSSEAWLRAFLDCADPGQWEEAYKGYNRDEVRRERRSMWRGFRRAECVPKRTYLTSDAVAGAARSLVKMAFDSPAPLPLRTLCGEIPPGVDARTTADAFKAAVRYLLLFPALRADSYEAVFWIRPSIGNRLHRAPVAKPQPQPVEEFSVPPFFLEDASLVAARALAEPLRVKKNSWGTDLFEKARRELMEALGDLPEPVGSRFPGEARLGLALLLSLKFISNSSSRISITKAGGDWLRQPASDRLQTLIDAFRKHRKPVGKAYYEWRSGPLGFSPLVALPWQTLQRDTCGRPGMDRGGLDPSQNRAVFPA